MIWPELPSPMASSMGASSDDQSADRGPSRAKSLQVATVASGRRNLRSEMGSMVAAESRLRLTLSDSFSDLQTLCPQAPTRLRTAATYPASCVYADRMCPISGWAAYSPSCPQLPGCVALSPYTNCQHSSPRHIVQLIRMQPTCRYSASVSRHLLRPPGGGRFHGFDHGASIASNYPGFRSR